MSGDYLFLDTNILLYYLKGDEALSSIFRGRTLALPFITEMELLSYSKITEEEETKIKELFKECVIVEMVDAIKKKAIETRKAYRLKLPDSIIAATAAHLDMPLITADTDLEKVEGVPVVIYK
jgi:predicted nucleic acid-binding protein